MPRKYIPRSYIKLDMRLFLRCAAVENDRGFEHKQHQCYQQSSDMHPVIIFDLFSKHLEA